MNQILCTEDYFVNKRKAEQKQTKKRKVLGDYHSYAWKISLRSMERKTLVSMVIICCICLIFSYCIYACGIILENNENFEEVANTEENINTEELAEVIEEPEIIQTTELIGLADTQYTTKSGDSYTICAMLNIPSLEIYYPVLSKNSDELLEISLNKYWGPEPNEVGNCVIVGHNYRNKTHFGKLPGIKIGDEVELTDSEGRTLTYVVYETDIIQPDDTQCTSQLTDGRTEITLITCANGGASRFIAKCVAIEK